MWGGRYSTLTYSWISFLLVNFNKLTASGPSQLFTILKAAEEKQSGHRTLPALSSTLFYVLTHISWNQFERGAVNVFLLRQGMYHSLIPEGGFTVGTALTGFKCPMGIQEDSITPMLTEQLFRGLTSDHIYQCGLSSTTTLRQWTKLLCGSGRNCMMPWRIFYFVLLLINPQFENPPQRKRQKQEEEALLIMGVNQNQLPSWLKTLHFPQASPFI